MKIKCPNCGFSGEYKQETKGVWIALSILISILMFPIGLLFPILLYVFTKHPKCPKCRYKNVIKL